MVLIDSNVMQNLISAIECLICEESHSEYDLLQALKSQGFFSFMQSVPASSHALFCAHFLLFHALYQLREVYWQQGRYHLDISPLSIRLLPYQSADNQLNKPDPLREYYLDLEQLRNTSADDVDELLNSFWSDFLRNDQRSEALTVLELNDPVDDEEIRRHYKKLVMKHHPDRGGDSQFLQSINEAMIKLGK